MKRYLGLISCVAVIAIAFIAIPACRAEEKSMVGTKEKHSHAMVMATDANMCPMNMKMKCCMMCSPDQMKKCGVSEAMSGKCAMMMKTSIMPTDPEALLAMEGLKLTPEQSKKLKTIAENARKEAAAVLSAEQTQMVDKMNAEPATMSEMHKMMHQKMTEKMKEMKKCADSNEMSMKMEQKICPVSGKPIDKKYSTVYKGKTVYFCCPMCKPTFDKDPEKYISKLPQFKTQ